MRQIKDIMKPKAVQNTHQSIIEFSEIEEINRSFNTQIEGQMKELQEELMIYKRKFLNHIYNNSSFSSSFKRIIFSSLVVLSL